MSEETVRYTKSGTTAYLTLNRPHKHNAIDLAARDTLWTYLRAARDDPELQVLCIGGAGENFSTGADIGDFGTAPSLWAAREARRQRDLWWLLEELPCITIAALHGYCYGAGIELALYCDLRVAADNARIALPEVGLGYIPSAGGTQMLPRMMVPGVALGVVCSGEELNADQALRWGLMNRVVPRAQLDSTVTQLARSLQSDRPALHRAVKRAIRRGLDLPLDAALRRDALTALSFRCEPSHGTGHE